MLTYLSNKEMDRHLTYTEISKREAGAIDPIQK